MKDALRVTIVLMFLLPAALLAQEPLAITEVIPASGPTSGGTPVIIRGTGFSDQCQILCSPHGILFGNVPSTDVTILDATTITAITPPQPAGRVDVIRLQTMGFEARLVAGFTYVEGSALRLQGGRFAAEVSAVNRRDGRVSRGIPIPYNDQFGFFYLPDLTADPANPEIFVKVVGPLPDGTHLLFYGGLTDFEYTLTITDMTTGVVNSYVKTAGEFRGDLLH